MIDDQPDLAKRFAELRAEESRLTPRFDPRRRHAKRFAPRGFAIAAASLVVAALLAAVWIPDQTPAQKFDHSDRLAVRAVDAWRAPTEFLLLTPGRELLVTTPVIPDVADILRSPKGSSR